jgi:hypothetical protein
MASISVWGGEIREELADGTVRYIRPCSVAESLQHKALYVAHSYRDGRAVGLVEYGSDRAELVKSDMFTVADRLGAIAGMRERGEAYDPGEWDVLADIYRAHGYDALDIEPMD